MKSKFILVSPWLLKSRVAVPFWVPIIIRHLLFRVPKKGTIILTTTHILADGQANFFVGQVEDNSGTEWLEPRAPLHESIGVGLCFKALGFRV